MLRYFSFLLLVSFFVLTGKSYFYAPAVVLEAEVEAAFSPRFMVYYTTNEYDDFSDARFGYSLGKTDENKISACLPAEKIKRLLVVPYDWQQRGSKGRYVKDPQPQGEETYTLASPRIIDSTGIMVPTEDISLVESGVRTPADKPCRLSDGGGTDRAMYELKEETTFAKRFYAVRFVQVAAWALLCAWLVMWAVVVDPLATTEKKKHVLYAALAAVALGADFAVTPVYGASQNMAWLTYLPQMWRNCDFLHLALLIPLYLLYRAACIRLAPQERSSKAAKALAVLLSVFILLGQSYRESGSYGTIFGFDYAQSIKTAVVFFGYVVFVYPLLLLLFKGLNVAAEKVFADEDSEGVKNVGCRILERYGVALSQRPFLTSFCTVIVFYIPFLILKYPCCMSVDGYFQSLQGLYAGEHLDNVAFVSSWDVEFSSHHPIAHTLIISCFLKFGLLLGNVYYGMLLYSCMQLFVVASVVAFSVWTLIKYGHLRIEVACALIGYFVLHPFINDYMFLVTKDVLYASFILAYLSLNFAYIRSVRREEKRKMLKCSFYVCTAIVAALASAFRNEGGMVLIGASILAIACNVKLAKPMCCAAIAALSAMSLCNLVSKVLDIRKGPKVEMFSIPCQQLARTLKEHEEVFSLPEKRYIYRMFQNQNIAYLYSSGTSDPVKSEFYEDIKGKNVNSLLSLWVKCLIKSPQTCVDAFLHNYYLYFLPDSRLMEDDIGSAPLTFELGKRLGCSIGNSYIVYCGSLISQFVKFRNYVISIPFLNLPMLAATYTWSVLFILAYVVRHKCKDGLALMMLPLCLMLMPFLGPTNGDFGRYTYPLMLCLPFVILAVLRSVKDKLDKNNG